MMESKQRVVASYNLDDGLRCVDILEGPPGRFRFAVFRRDPEDNRGWYPIPGTDGTEFPSAEAARDAAARAVPGLDEVLRRKRPAS
jgi:broad specificity phosphatase PhoE